MKKHLFLSIILFLCFWSFFIEPNCIEIKHFTIVDKELSGIKIVLVGDFHLKPQQTDRLNKIVNLIKKQNPEMILSIGDFISGHNYKNTMPIEQIASTLAEINPQYGFYTVLGNHDWWLDGEKITKELEQNNIKVLANSNKKIKIKDKTIYIAGVEDLYTREPNIYKALNGTKNPTILLTHSPDIFKKVSSNVNLTLAGHTHGGQVRIPFIGGIVVPSAYGERYAKGFIYEDGKKMIITKGLGTSILPVRFNCKPEIVVIEFK